MDELNEVEQPMSEKEIDAILDGAIDPAAPYGRFRNGNPRKRPAKNGRPARTPLAPAAPGKRARKPPASGDPDYTAMARSTVQIAGGLFGIAATITRRPTLALDSATLIVHQHAMAEGWGQAAVDDARIARFLESVSKVGSVSAALGPTMAVCAQILVNHGRIPAGTMGTVTPEKLMESAERMVAEMNAG